MVKIAQSTSIANDSIKLDSRSSIFSSIQIQFRIDQDRRSHMASDQQKENNFTIKLNDFIILFRHIDRGKRACTINVVHLIIGTKNNFQSLEDGRREMGRKEEKEKKRKGVKETTNRKRQAKI